MGGLIPVVSTAASSIASSLIASSRFRIVAVCRGLSPWLSDLIDRYHRVVIHGQTWDKYTLAFCLKAKTGFPICELLVTFSAKKRAERLSECLKGFETAGMSEAAYSKGFIEMSRMTLLKSAVWLGRDTGNGELPGNVRTDGYPPFNIELLPTSEGDAETFRVTLAVAGFKREDLDVTVADGVLVVHGSQRENEGAAPREYLHRGIAARQFKRSFGLADGVEVCKAELHNGLLIIELRRFRKVQPVRKVGIVSGR